MEGQLCRNVVSVVSTRCAAGHVVRPGLTSIASLSDAELWDLEVEHELLIQFRSTKDLNPGEATRISELERELVSRTMPMTNPSGVSPGEVSSLVEAGVIPKSQGERVLVRICGFRATEARQVTTHPSSVAVAYGLPLAASIPDADPWFGTLTSEKIEKMQRSGAISKRTARRLRNHLSP